MRSAALRRKVRISEDVLTASLFDIVRGANGRELLQALLNATAVHHQPGRRIGDRLKVSSLPRVQLWPRWTSGEPDVVLEWNERDGTDTCLIVEVKYESPLSTSKNPIQDQLAKYLVDAHRQGFAQKALVFLTAHDVLPERELRRSARKLSRHGVHAALGWLNWRHVDGVLREHGRAFPDVGVADAAALLRSLRLASFCGEWKSDQRDVSKPRWPTPYRPTGYSWSLPFAVEPPPHMFWSPGRAKQ